MPSRSSATSSTSRLSTEVVSVCRELDVAVITTRSVRRGEPHREPGSKTSRWPQGDWAQQLYFVPEELYLAQSVDRAEALRPLVPQRHDDARFRLAAGFPAEPAVSTIIPGMRKIKHVESNLAASDGRPLDASLLEQLIAPPRRDRTPTDWSPVNSRPFWPFGRDGLAAFRAGRSACSRRIGWAIPFGVTCRRRWPGGGSRRRRPRRRASR